MGVPTREFRVDEFGAPRYPELVVATTNRSCEEAGPFTEGLRRGYVALAQDPQDALGDLLGEVPDLDPDSQEAQLEALVAAQAFSPQAGASATPALSAGPDGSGGRWLIWAVNHGLIDASQAPKVIAGFRPAGAGCS
jgi:hypothetical protein